MYPMEGKEWVPELPEKIRGASGLWEIVGKCAELLSGAAVLCLGDSISGILILLLMGYEKIVWIAAGAFIRCYQDGCAVSILAVSRINLMELLSKKEQT